MVGIAALIDFLRKPKKSRSVDWLMSIAPPEIDESLSKRRDIEKKRQRARRKTKKVSYAAC
jgi:hypothetical protein